MSLKIRLARGGARKKPFYKIVVADIRSPRDGRFIEKVGTFNPMVANDHDEWVNFKEDRIKYWLGVGAKPTDRVARLMSTKGLCEKPAIPEQTKKHKLKAKALERLEEKQAAEKEAAEAKVAADEAAKQEAAVEEQAPAEEVPAEEAVAQEEAPAEDTQAEASKES